MLGTTFRRHVIASRLWLWKRGYSVVPAGFLQARTQGGALGAHAPPPPPGKTFRSEMSERGEKVPPRYVGKKDCARSAQIRQIKTKMVRKGIQLKK